MPSLAPAMRAAGRDNVRMAYTRDAIVLAIRAIREGFHVLRALGYPIIPKSVAKLGASRTALVKSFKKATDPQMRAAMLEHAQAAQDQTKHLADEFITLARQTTVPTPVMDRLYAYFDTSTPPLPEGSAEIPLDWRAFCAGRHYAWYPDPCRAPVAALGENGDASTGERRKWVFGWRIVGLTGEI